jgi:hypothetical protein
MLNRETKKELYEVISPPSAGKNWFFDPLLIFMGSTGQIQSANKSTNFALDNCFSKRVLFYNEPDFEASFGDKLLIPCAGDPISDQAKYTSVAQIARTPGNGVNPNEPKWNDRMFCYKWKRCEWLKHIDELKMYTNGTTEILCTFLQVHRCPPVPCCTACNESQLG